jgi:hypothetical protein
MLANKKEQENNIIFTYYRNKYYHGPIAASADAWISINGLSVKWDLDGITPLLAFGQPKYSLFHLRILAILCWNIQLHQFLLAIVVVHFQISRFYIQYHVQLGKIVWNWSRTGKS